MRDFKLYLDDIRVASSKILSFTEGYTFSRFKSDQKTVDAVIRNLEVIGEASKRIPKRLREKH